MMKKLIVIMLALAALVAMGCKSKPDEKQVDPRSSIIGAEGVPRPDWMNRTPKSDDIYYVVGDGRDGPNATVKQGTARADALAKLAQWKSAVVADTMKNYVDESGVPGNTQTLIRFEQATVTRSTANVAGFDEVEKWVDQNGIYHILYEYPKSGLVNDFKSTVSEFQRNEAAAFAEFKSNEAFKYLEAQLDKAE
jgi:hypothetical protein